MNIIRCHIDNFGKLSNIDIEFDGGINTRLEENAWGKSTLAAFLKAMFYGFSNKKERDSIEKERAFYQPWQGGTYGGDLEFSVNGKSYRVSRTFGKTDKSDDFHLYNLTTNLESNDYSRNLGEQIFDLDMASFKRSIFIAQNDCESASTDGINAKLGNLVENTNDINNYEGAMNTIKDLLNKLTPSRYTGSIRRREDKITGLKQELRSYVSAEEAFDELNEMMKAKNQEKERIEEDRKESSTLLKKTSIEGAVREKRKIYAALVKDEQDMDEQMKAILERFPNGVPNEETMASMQQAVTDLEGFQSSIDNFTLSNEEEDTYESLKEKFVHGVPSDPDIADSQKLIDEFESLQLKQASSGMTQVESSKLSEYKSKFGTIEDPSSSKMEMQGLINRIEAAQRRMGELQNKETKLSYLEALEQQQAKSQQLVQQKKISLFTVIGIVAAIVGLILCFALPPVGIIVLIVGTVLVIIGLKGGNNLKQAEVNTPTEENSPAHILRVRVEQERNFLNGESQEFSRILSTYNIYCAPEQYIHKCYELISELSVYETLLEKEKSSNDETIKNKSILLEKRITGFIELYYELPTNAKYRETVHKLTMDVSTYNRLSEKNEKLNKARTNASDKKLLVEFFLREFDSNGDDTIQNQLLKLQTAIRRETTVRELLDGARRKRIEFEQVNELRTDEGFMEESREVNDNETKPGLSLEEINERISTLDRNLDQIREVIIQYTNQMNALQEQMNQREEREQELEECIQEKQKEQEQYDLLMMTQKYLQDARESFTARYMAPISKGFEKYYDILTGEKKEPFIIDANIDVKIREEGEYRDVKWLSAGWKDLVGICMRFALVDAMYEGEKPFLVLDDPFVNLDEEKIRQGMKILKEAARHYQILYFTCHRSRAMMNNSDNI